MTNQQGAPEALRPIKRFYNGTDGLSENQSGDWVRYDDHAAALVEAQQPAPSAAAAFQQRAKAWQPPHDGIRAALTAAPPDGEWRGFAAECAQQYGAEYLDDDAKLVVMTEENLVNMMAALGYPTRPSVPKHSPQPSPTPQADSQPAPACKGENCAAVRGVGHSQECEAEHERSAGGLDTAGNRNPDARYAGYTGQPKSHGYTADQLAAWEEGVAARAPDSVTAAAGEATAGWQTVPVSPDEWMEAAGNEQLRLGKNAGDVWDAMLAAAPTPPAQAADSVLEDAECWRLIVARLDEPNIDTVAHIRTILAAHKQGANHD